MPLNNRVMTETRKRVLIIKPGYSETLDPDETGVVSLGDVLRTTVILHLYPPDQYHVTWVTDQMGAPLLKGNPFIHRLLVINPFTPHLLLSEWFDIVINFEKEPGICAVSDHIPAWRRYGFRFDPQTSAAVAYDHSDEALSITVDPTVKRRNTKSWSDILYEMLGQKYQGQPSVLGSRPSSKILYDVGLNHLIGWKFPLKRWPIENWKALFDKLSPEKAVCWQQGESDLETYIDWIASCRLLVTNDSLGMHIALALDKPVVALFGPTNATEPSGKWLVKLTPPLDWDCIPCLDSNCGRSAPCISKISVDRVKQAICELLSATSFSSKAPEHV